METCDCGLVHTSIRLPLCDSLTHLIERKKIPMSKYETLWRFLQSDGSQLMELSFDRIKEIVGFELDHSFLNYKKDALSYGYTVDKISMKKRTVIFRRNAA